jgi:myo-inositol-1(or 4)-monophosphatase
MLPLAAYQRVCIEAAYAGGAVLLDWAGRFSAREKGPSDLVTEADLASQECVQERLLSAFPLHGFLAEENANIPSSEDGLRWIVDPLDGTMNYVHGVPGYAVSIALEQAGKPLVGVVYDPILRECYSAIAGGGAFLNDRPIRTTAVTELSQALVATSFSAKVPPGSPEISQFAEILIRSQSTRRMGSAALNLCYVAAGRFDAYFALNTKIWDVAAGVLLVREAGGVITDVSGGELDLEKPRFVAAATSALNTELRGILAK